MTVPTEQIRAHKEIPEENLLGVLPVVSDGNTDETIPMDGNTSQSGWNNHP